MRAGVVRIVVWHSPLKLFPFYRKDWIKKALIKCLYLIISLNGKFKHSFVEN